MKKISFFFSLLLLSIPVFSQEEVKLKNGRTIIVNPEGTWKYKQDNSGNNTFVDSRDGHVYKTVVIGTQTWMAENLAYKANGGCWAYDNKPSNIVKYGYLYNWETAKAACPPGWHIPSVSEWETLVKTLGGSAVAGGKMKATGTTHWNKPNNGATNKSGFTALPGGTYNTEDGFSSIGTAGNWWSSTSYMATTAKIWYVVYNYPGVYDIADSDTFGYSVRCIKD